MSEIEEMSVPDETAPHYRLHGSPDSANFVVRMILEELGVPYDYVPVDRLVLEQKSEAYRKLNPQGLIPVLEIEGQDAPMFETGAILLFLSDTHGRLAPDTFSSERGRFLKWLFFLSNTLHSDLRISFKPHRYLKDRNQLDVIAEPLMARISTSFQQIEKEIAATGGPYVLGDRLSCLDHYLAACARWAQVYGCCGDWSLKATPGMRNMLEELELRPAVRHACKQELIEGSPFVTPKAVTLPGTTT
ncbi:MAG: glutathione S-transferase family protein [Roseibium sp.]|uniref:glutathione S-transferase family protein n=1 Tax=Roseibium sp. TaxID=1936156 RepID=UPI00262EA7FF|nr:glutathione S-transferase family protein [Roseibium sp.]MCV0424295.1 glutathione S-transferase family protein [Roseibium sp.]